MAPRQSELTALPIVIAGLINLLTASVTSSGFCPHRCHCEDEYLRASCSYAGLDVVPIQLNPEIRHLDLSGNRVASLHMTLTFYDNLESLDLSSNQIHKLGSENFVLQQRLTNLNLSNNAIKTLTRNALKGLTSLRTLDLSNNNITDIDQNAFRETSELEFLNLSGNSITSLPDGLLRNLHDIRSLVIRRNSLLEMPSKNLALAPSLEELDLADNLIQEIEAASLPSLRSLVSLNLANNVIRSIAEDAFANLPGLVYLDLQGNNLTSVPTETLARLNVLASLNLGRNPLSVIETLAFRNLYELKNLDLRECTIARIRPRAFGDNVNLETIDLDGNHDLGELPARVLYNSRYLKSVSLRRCNLASLQPTHFPVDGMSTLRLGGNPFVCNCSVHWLWNVIHAENVVRNESARLDLDSEDIVCADEEYMGKTLASLSESSLRCRLSPLYLSLSAIGCLLATATILALIAYVTRAKRRKRPAYSPPSRPELLVYVGRGHDGPDKNPESFSRRLIGRNEEILYDLPRGKPPLEPSPQHLPRFDNSHQASFESSQHQPRREFENSASDVGSFYQTRYPGSGVSSRDFDACSPVRNSTEDRYNQQTRSTEDVYENRLNNEGVYAVADVTSLREAPPEVRSLYRMHSPKSRVLQPRMARNNADYDYDYEYDYEYERPSLPEKPHVVFV